MPNIICITVCFKDIEIDPTEVVIPPDGSPQDEPTPLSTKAPTASKKRKRRRKNEYDFGPKRKRAKKKATTTVSNQQENAITSNNYETNSQDASPESKSFDPDSLNAVKDLYGHSEEKRYQEGLFSDQKLSDSYSYQENLFNDQKHTDSISYQESLFINHTLSSEPKPDLSQESTKVHKPASTKTHKPASTSVRADILSDHLVNESSSSCDPAKTTTSGHVIEDGDRESAQTTDRMLIQTTCCQFYKSRRKPSQNEARSYRRKHGLWMKGRISYIHFD